MLKQTLIITSAVLATALVLSGESVADNDAKGHGLAVAKEAAATWDAGTVQRGVTSEHYFGRLC
jgi:hypothetical protein